MNKRIIRCPHCGDTWEYELLVDFMENKCVVTKCYDFLEEGQDCVCYKCHNHYTLRIPEDDVPDVTMNNFIYNIWRRCKM